MGLINSKRLEKRRIGLNNFKRVIDNRKKTLVIHYSCESFYNSVGRTPRITSICVKNRANNETKAFSIHLQAQFNHVNLNSASNEVIDKLELEMLNEFGEYVKLHSTYFWVHWNMKNASYGFEAISNRSRIVGGKAIIIEDDMKFDLPIILGNIFTHNFAPHKPDGQLFNTSRKNHITLNDALTGKEEADAFDNSDYLKLHMSTMRKVEMIDRIIEAYELGTLKTTAKSIEIYGLSIFGIIEIIKSSPILLMFWSIIMFIIGAALEPVIQFIFGTDKLP